MRWSFTAILVLVCLLPWRAEARTTPRQVYCVTPDVAAAAVRVYATTKPMSLKRIIWLFWDGNIQYCAHMEPVYPITVEKFVDVIYEGDKTFGYLPYEYYDGQIRYLIFVVDSRGT